MESFITKFVALCEVQTNYGDLNARQLFALLRKKTFEKLNNFIDKMDRTWPYTYVFFAIEKTKLHSALLHAITAANWGLKAVFPCKKCWFFENFSIFDTKMSS